MPQALLDLNVTMSKWAGIQPGTMSRLLWTLTIVLGYAALRAVVSRATVSRVQNPARRYLIIKSVNYSVGAAVVLALLRIWSVETTHLAAYLGLVSAALVVTLQAPIANFAGWIALNVQKPFVVGDRIQVGAAAGDVVDISLFAFSLLEVGREEAGEQSTGRIIHVPNGVVFRENITNATKGFDFVWNEVSVSLRPDSNWTRARHLLADLANRFCADKVNAASSSLARAGHRYMLLYGHLTPIVWTTFRDKRIILTVRYLCEARQRRVSTSHLWEAILTEFAPHDDIHLD